MYLNKVQLIGNLTRDPELKSLPSGIKVTSFAIATNRTWKDADGSRKEASEFHNIVAFAKPAELIAQYCKKDNSIYVEGRLQTRSWDDQATGQKKYRTEIIVENFQFGPKSSGTSSASFEPSSPGGRPAKAVKKSEDIDAIEYPDDDINPEDIPF